ncbi:MAG: cobalt-zinc-cadmium efflux system outer membrane protein [Yoonia sp.]|jgi:cobalt-zinc-cadmium efflux system outer membrane protein
MVTFSKIGRSLAFALIAQAIVSGLSAEPLRLTKAQAVAQALQANAGLMAARTTIDRAQGNFRQAGRWSNPELSLDYATDQTFNNEGEYGFALGLQQRFPVTNRLRMQKAIAHDEIELAQVEVANQTRLLVQEVELSINSVAELQAQIALRAERRTLNQKFTAFLESRIETGEASAIDANQIKIEIYAVDQELQQLQNELAEQLTGLRQFMGVADGVEVKPRIDFELPQASPELGILTRESLPNHPEYRMKSLLLRIADKQVSVAKAERWADIALRVFFEEEKSVDDPGGLGRDRYLGVGVSIPLPVMDRNNGAIEASRALRRQMKYELDYVGSKLRSEAKIQRERALNLYTQAQDYQTNLTQRVNQNVADMNTAYSAGQISLTELFRSQEQALKIQSTHLEMLHDYEQAMILWKAATAQQGAMALQTK